MYTWISRVLLLVFSFQVIAPQLVQAQGVPYGVPGVPPAGTGYSYRTMDVPTDSLEDKVRAAAERAKDKPFSQATTLAELDQMYNDYREELLDLYDTIEVNNMADYSALYDAVITLHKLSDEYYPHLKKFQAQEEAHARRIAEAEERRRQMREVSMPLRPVIVNDATYVAPSASGQLMQQAPLDIPICDFTDPSELTVEDVVERIDPFPEIIVHNNAFCTATAAEMLIHTIDALISQSALSEEDTDFWTDYLPRLSARMQYKYYRLPDVTSSSDPSTIMLVGSYRVLLYKVHQLYKKLGLQDPLTWKRIEMDVPVYKIRPNVLAYNAYVENYKKQVQKIREEYQKKPKRLDAPRDVGPLIPPMLSLEEFQAQGERTITQDEWAQFSFQLPWGYENAGSTGTEHKVSEEDDGYLFFRKILDKFKSEFYAIKNNKETKPGSTLYASLRTQIETMLAFSTTIGEPSTLGTVVVAFDENEKVDEITKVVTPSPLLVEHAELIQTAFNTVVSTLKNLPPNDTAAINYSKEKIVALAGPAYSTATRIAAIGAAGMLNKASEWTEEGSQSNSATDNALAFDQETREKLVGYAADFYKDFNPLYNYYENYTQEEQDIIAGKDIRGNPSMAAVSQHTSSYERLTRPFHDYGLDSKQMVIVQDQLVTDIHNLLPVNAPGRIWNVALSRYQADHAQISLTSIPDNTGKPLLNPLVTMLSPGCTSI